MCRIDIYTMKTTKVLGKIRSVIAPPKNEKDEEFTEMLSRWSVIQKMADAGMEVY